MATLGILGGMSWHSTAEYYRSINERVAGARGGHASARILLSSQDFAEVRDLQVRGDWAGAAELLAGEARALERAGADCVAIATNLMHRVAGEVEASIGVPLVHIADAVAAGAREAGARRLGVVGSGWVMAESFYADRLAQHGIGTVVPDAAERDRIDAIVFDELTQGIVRAESRALMRTAIAGLVERGAEAVVLACTEIMLLVGPEDAAVPLLDSCELHAAALARIALGDASADALAPHPLERVEHRADGRDTVGTGAMAQEHVPA